jgi:hypothetical protein
VSSVYIPFTPSTTSVFSFSPTLGGTTYNATVTWNVFGQRYYINITDLSSNHILTTAIVSSGPRWQVSLSWANGFATAVATTPHNITIGASANLRVSETGTGFDGNWQVWATSATTFQYTAPNPEVTTSPNGTAQQPANLVGGVLPGAWLLFHYDSMEFEYEAATT